MDFVDTNVLLYAYDASAGERHESARELVGRLGRQRDGAVSVQVLQEFYVNAVSKIASRLTPTEARQRLTALSHWTVHAPSTVDVITATTLSEDHQISFWDAMILQSAIVLGCTTLWSEDLNHLQVIGGVTVRDPFR